MATHAPITGAPSRAPVIRHPAALPPMPAVQRILLRYARHDRETLEAFLSVAIDLLDLLDGDSDFEDNNDREAHDGDDQGDQAWIEWHTRGSHKLRRGIAEPTGNDCYGNSLREDDEDDDAAEQDDHEGQCDEDGVNTAFGASGPGCMLSDPGGEVLAH